MCWYYWLVLFDGAKMDFLIKLIEALLAFLKRPPPPTVEVPLPEIPRPEVPKLQIRAGLLIDIYGCTLTLAEKYADPLAKAMERFDITTPLRMAHFLAQVGQESGGLRYSKELWGPTTQQLKYERDMLSPWPQEPRDAKLPMYDRNRLAYRLGNCEFGDGSKYRGRGLIQLTGRSNYIRSGSALGYNFVDTPEIVERAEFSALTAAEFWAHNGCNELADKDDVVAITKRVNGGTTHLDERKEYLRKAKIALGC